LEKLLKYLKAPVSLYLRMSSKSNPSVQLPRHSSNSDSQPCLQVFFPFVSPPISPAFPHKDVELIYKPSRRGPRPLACWFLVHRHGSSKSLAERELNLPSLEEEDAKWTLTTPVNQDPSVSPSPRLPSPNSAANKASRRAKTKAKPATNGGSDRMSENTKRWLQEDKSEGPWTGQ